MLNNFLRETYKAKAVSRQFLQNNLKCWKISDSQMIKTFKFEDFQSAMAFVNLAGQYVKEYGISANISNVYNQVTVTIEEKGINQLTSREYQAAVYLNEMGSVNDPIEDILKTDYYQSHFAFPQRYSLEINNLIPSDPFQPKKAYLISSKSDNELKLI